MGARARVHVFTYHTYILHTRSIQSFAGACCFGTFASDRGPRVLANQGLASPPAFFVFPISIPFEFDGRSVFFIGSFRLIAVSCPVNMDFNYEPSPTQTNEIYEYTS